MKRTLSLLTTLILTLCLLCSCFGGDGQDDIGGEDNPYAVLGDYEISIESCRFAANYSEDPVIIVKYKFKNNDSLKSSFYTSIDTVAYQNGVELEETTLVHSSADFSSSNQTKSVNTGASLFVEVAYELIDRESDVRIVASEALSFSNAKATKTFPITVTNFNITDLDFNSASSVTLSVGQRTSPKWVLVDVVSRDEFSTDDVVFVSENPDIATIEFDSQALTVYLYYTITGVSKGTTYVYAKSSDGSVVSEKIKVTVN